MLFDHVALISQLRFPVNTTRTMRTVRALQKSCAITIPPFLFGEATTVLEPHSSVELWNLVFHYTYPHLRLTLRALRALHAFFVSSRGLTSRQLRTTVPVILRHMIPRIRNATRTLSASVTAPGSLLLGRRPLCSWQVPTLLVHTPTACTPSFSTNKHGY